MKWSCLLFFGILAVAANRGAGARELVLSDFEDLSRWEGLEADTEIVHEGRQAGRWADPTVTTAVHLKSPPTDWSPYQGLSFWVHNQVTNGKRIDVIAFSEAGTYDYFQYYFTLDWTGWKFFQVPFTQFGQVRRPRGWDQITAFFFSATWGDVPDKETVMRLDDMRLTDDVPPAVSDLMSDEELFARLDLDRPGLEESRAAAGRADFAAARTALLAYYRTRTSPRHYVDPDQRPAPDPNFDTAAADRVAKHVFTFYSYPPQQLPEKIDWTVDPVGDYEWPTALNRHGDFTTLARAWFYTGSDHYATALEGLMGDWIGNARAANVRLSNVFWSTLNIACRLADAWPHVWYYLRDSDAFGEEVRIALLKSLWHQAEYLMQYHGSGNWLLTESRALVTVGTLFPEFRRAADWKAEGWARLSREIQAQTYPEGAQIELTPHYHLVCIGAFRGPVNLARLNGETLPEELLGRLEKMVEYLALVSKPDRCIPMLNDSDHNNIQGLLRDGYSLFPREDFRFIATDGTEGTAPAETSIAFPYAGQYVMRTGWDRQAIYCLVDAGPYGYSHQHEDKLNLDLHAFGADLLLDPGRFTYAGGPWRSFFLESTGHNLVLVDGHGQNRARTPRERWVAKAPVPATWFTTPEADYVRARYDEGFGPENDRTVTHDRTVLFVKGSGEGEAPAEPGWKGKEGKEGKGEERNREGEAPAEPGSAQRRTPYFVVCDRLLPADGAEHTYDFLWHFGAGEAAAQGRQITFRSEGAGLFLDTTLTAAPDLVQGREDPPQGWISYWYGQKQPAPTAIYHTRSTGPLTVLTLLCPFPGDAAPTARLAEPPAAPQTNADADVQAVIVPHAEGRDLLLFSQAGAAVRYGAVETDAEAAGVRYGADGEVQAAFRVGGTYLRVGGKR